MRSASCGAPAGVAHRLRRSLNARGTCGARRMSARHNSLRADALRSDRCRESEGTARGDRGPRSSGCAPRRILRAPLAGTPHQAPGLVIGGLPFGIARWARLWGAAAVWLRSPLGRGWVRGQRREACRGRSSATPFGEQPPSRAGRGCASSAWNSFKLLGCSGRSERPEVAPRSAAVLGYGEHRRCEIGSRSRPMRPKRAEGRGSRTLPATRGATHRV